MAITRARGKLGGPGAPADPGRALSSAVLLPQPLSSFVGRERELKELEELIAKVRLLTLTGPGGSGKTRLAIEISRLTSVRSPTDMAFVDLASISDPGLVVSTVATALGIRPKAGRSLMEAIVEHLAARPVVLVLDNLEQLLPDAATTIAELLGSCPDLRVLATSRAPLHIRGEHQYAVDSLVQAEALLLFVERARSVVSHFAPTEDNTAAMTEVCRRLDGLPLAIELAAACSKVMSPQALLRRLEKRVPMPASAAVDAPARQRTLRDTMAWSYSLLHRSDQRVFARLSVFVGGFSGPAVEDIVPDPNDEAPIDVMASIEHLVDHNLVRAVPDAQGEARFQPPRDHPLVRDRPGVSAGGQEASGTSRDVLRTGSVRTMGLRGRFDLARTGRRRPRQLPNRMELGRSERERRGHPQARNGDVVVLCSHRPRRGSGAMASHGAAGDRNQPSHDYEGRCCNTSHDTNWPLGAIVARRKTC